MKMTLIEEVEFLRERVKQLDNLLTPTAEEVPLSWSMTGQEAKIVGHLRRIAPRMASCDALMCLLYDDRYALEPDIIKVFVCKIRRKLRNTGFHIETRWGQGYLFAAGEDPSDRKRLPAAWTEHEDALIRASTSVADGAAKTGRTKAAVQNRAASLGHRWSMRRWSTTDQRRMSAQDNEPALRPNPSKTAFSHLPTDADFKAASRG